MITLSNPFNFNVNRTNPNPPIPRIALLYTSKWDMSTSLESNFVVAVTLSDDNKTYHQVSELVSERVKEAVNLI